MKTYFFSLFVAIDNFPLNVFVYISIHIISFLSFCISLCRSIFSDMGIERTDEVIVEDRTENESISEDNSVVIEIVPGNLEVIEESAAVPECSSRRILWSKKLDEATSTIPNFIQPDYEPSHDTDSDVYLGNPIWYFRKFFTSAFLDLIVDQSNL